MRLLSLFILVLVLGACSQGQDPRKTTRSQNPYETTKNYFTSTTKLTVEVAYESGHAPYANGTTLTLSGNTVPIWQILDENLNALFLGRTPYPSISVPKALADMQELPAQGKASWTTDDLLKLAGQYRTGRSSVNETFFWVVFLGGYFHDGTAERPTTVGVSLGGTTVIAIFKDVVRATDGGAGIVPLYVEQATVVHEMGHALGLVNNGLPLKAEHQDSEHGVHCANPDCVMYWLNEGRRDLVQFALRLSQAGSVIMFDQHCLQDARGF